MAKLYNLARMTTATAGTGTITLGAAVSGYLTFSGAGAADGDVVTYAIKDGANSEIGTGTYTLAGTTLTRTVITSTNSNSAISLSGSAEVFITPSNQDFLAPGTLMLFQQSTAPVGWTKQTTHNDKALRVVSGAASFGGSNAFSTVMAQTAVGATTLTAAQIPGHIHPVFLNDPGHNHTTTWIQPAAGAAWDSANGSGSSAGVGGPATGVNSTGITVRDTPGGGGTANQTAQNTGGGGSHNHSVVMAIQYVDLIIASKN